MDLFESIFGIGLVIFLIGAVYIFSELIQKIDINWPVFVTVGIAVMFAALFGSLAFDD